MLPRLLVVVAWLVATTASVHADTVALLPLDGEKRLEIYGQPVASEIGRALKAQGFDVVIVGAKMAVPDRAQLIVDGTIKADKNNAITLSIRIRDPHNGTVLETLPASAATLTTIDKAAADLSTRIVPAVKSHLEKLAKAAQPQPAQPVQPEPDRPVESRPPPPPSTPRLPGLLVAVAVASPEASTPELVLLARSIAAELPRWGTAHKRDTRNTDAQQLSRKTAVQAVRDAQVDLGLGLEVIHFAIEHGTVPMARARVRARVVHNGVIVFERIVRTDTVVGDKGISQQDMAARTGREVLAIVNAQLRRKVAGVAMSRAAARSFALLALCVFTTAGYAQPAPAPKPQPAPAPNQSPAPPNDMPAPTNSPAPTNDMSPAPAPAPAPSVQPPGASATADPSLALREANAAATAGDWARVSAYVEPLLARSLDRNDLAEAHRLAGIAALFSQPPRRDLAETHFLEYLKIDLDAQLDPALYPPEVITFFSDVRVRHASELRARRPKTRYAILNLLPPWGQFQNGDRTKGIIIGSLLGAFLVTNVTTYLVLRSWCQKLTGPDGKTSAGCDETTNRNDSAATLRGLNITAGVGLIITYVYGVYDGIRGYGKPRRERALAPYATSTNSTTTFGVRMNF